MKPLIKVPTSNTSGISVGQRLRKLSFTLGNSSAVNPRKPVRFASKCTCQNTPKKCMKAGTMAAITIVEYGKPKNSIIRNAAAPMIGGVICPPVDAAASTAPAKWRG